MSGELENTAEAANGFRLRLDEGLMVFPDPPGPSLVYTTIGGQQVAIENEAGQNGAMAQLNTRDLLVLQAFLNNAQTMVTVEIRRRNGMNDQVHPW